MMAAPNAQHEDGDDPMGLKSLERDPGAVHAADLRDSVSFWWDPEIEGLQHAGRLAEALELARVRMEAVEDQRPLPYGWAWGVAVLARRMGRYDLEIEVIERVLAIAAQGGTSPEPWESRLRDARLLASEHIVF